MGLGSEEINEKRKDVFSLALLASNLMRACKEFKLEGDKQFTGSFFRLDDAA